MALISRILAPGIFGAEAEDVGQQIFPHPQEELLVAQAAPKRRREFALGRSCARAALTALGHGGAVIGRDAGGVPLWPAGVVGAITHTQGYAASLAAAARQFSGIGVDAERIGGVTQDLWPRLFDADEREHLMTLGGEDRDVAATLLFSAKEACYKAWAIKAALPFREIHIAPQEGAFLATWSGKNLQGRFAVRGDLMLTAAWF